jgi:hypothetical protein
VTRDLPGDPREEATAMCAWPIGVYGYPCTRATGHDGDHFAPSRNVSSTSFKTTPTRTTFQLDPDPLVPEGWEQYTSPPETDDSGRALALVMVVVAAALIAVVVAVVLGWKP